MPPSILIADDYEDNRELLRLILEAAGYHVREARKPRLALFAGGLTVHAGLVQAHGTPLSRLSVRLRLALRR